MKIFINLFLIISLLQSCASTTIIKISDPEAKIFTDSKLIGTGSAVYTDRAISWSSTEFQIQRPGCQIENFVIKRNEQIDITALITGLLLVVPLVWIMKYNAVHAFDYNCD